MCWPLCPKFCLRCRPRACCCILTRGSCDQSLSRSGGSLTASTSSARGQWLSLNSHHILLEVFFAFLTVKMIRRKLVAFCGYCPDSLMLMQIWHLLNCSRCTGLSGSSCWRASILVGFLGFVLCHQTPLEVFGPRQRGLLCEEASASGQLSVGNLGHIVWVGSSN